MNIIYKLFLFFSLLAACSVNAQSIYNTLGDEGDFIVYDHTNTPILDLYLHLGKVRLDIGKKLNPTGLPTGSINVGDVSGTTSLNMSSFSGTGTGHNTTGPKIYFGKSRGLSTNALTIANTDLVGSLGFWGNHRDDNNENTSYTEGARIATYVDGTVNHGANSVPMKIVFSTMESGENVLTEKLWISNDGSVTISDLAGSGTVGLEVDANGKLVRGLVKSPENVSQAEIEALKQENAALKTRLAALEAKFEALINSPKP